MGENSKISVRVLLIIPGPKLISSVQFSSVITQSCLTPCNPVVCSMPGLELCPSPTPRVYSNSCPLSCFFNDPADVGRLISGSSAFSKTSLNIWKFTVYVLLKPGLENFEHYFTKVWDECNCLAVWAFFGIAFLWDWNENWPFPVLWPLLSFPNLQAYWVQHFHGIVFQNLKELNWNSITSTSFVHSDVF